MVEHALPAIPWAHSTTDLGSTWMWETPHFVVTVNGTERSCYYVLNVKTEVDGKVSLKFFSDGRAATFEQVENLIREAIGKSYPPALGYQRFAGHLATTFTIGTGESIDLGPYIGHEGTLTVTVKDPLTGVISEIDYFGLISVEHYEIVLDQKGSSLRISPSFLRAISIPEATPPSLNLPLAVDRMFSGIIEGQCNGRVGVIPGIIEHLGPLCPVHELDRLSP